MEQSTRMGMNRTGIDASPFDSKSMIEGAEKFFATQGDFEAAKSLKREYSSDAGSVGSVPVPGTAKGMMKSAMKKMAGHNPEMFINKLGERLAYERSGVRLYESFIEKCKAKSADGASKIPLERVQLFRDQELEHFQLLKRCLETLGADPTAQTPDADVSGVAALGLMKVVTDPRTSIGQCLEVMLSAELTDNAAWELLIKLAEDVGLDDMAQEFEHPLKQEAIHMKEIRQWYEASIRDQAQMNL